MAEKNVGKTKTPATGRTLQKTEYKFRYNAARDRCAIVIGTVIAAVILIVLCIICAVVGVPWQIVTNGAIVYVVIALLSVAGSCFNIYQRTFNILTIKKDEIVKCSGWMTKYTTTIPAYKIRSCTKSSTWLQRKCKTMDIAITTAGDRVEIYFSNIEAGERAYKLISQMAKENRHER